MRVPLARSPVFEKVGPAKALLAKVETVADDLKIDGGSCPTRSFVPGTRVLLADGSSKPIEEIRIGDRVQAADPETGESGTRAVVGTVTTESVKRLVTVTVDTDGDRGEATGSVVATDNHPFWVDNQGRWVHAGELKFGDQVLDASGARAAVMSTTERLAIQRVHNLTVDGIHTYYVVAGKAPLLAHNCDGEVVRHGPMNEGPLDAQTADSFRSSSYDAVVSTEATTVYRVYGGESEELGGYWTRAKPEGLLQAVMESALKRTWGNQAAHWVSAEISAGTKFFEGVAAAQGALHGGGSQVFIPTIVQQSWITGRGKF
ncbi:polymorphic toxin-type HINT domain-containing protein [Crossiella sp. CA198]|uniref:polymorphic toxin-type HINT domain-containing protein n=1 Tax=Crossiella sp. CA198 TaxID=3455607 RepID=UPI003F8D2640